MKNKIYILGDVHAVWGQLNTFINKKKPDIILQCGDFGWWPHIDYMQMDIKNKETKIYWCPGNHENWDSLDTMPTDKMHQIIKNVFYCPFGTVLTLENDMNVLFCGGASSVDYEQRILGHTWWQQEIITQEEMDRLPDINIDIVISHTAPRSFVQKRPEISNLYCQEYREAKYNDPSTFALDIVYDKYKPKYWFSGHFHKYVKDQIEDCLWIGLADIERSNHYVLLNDIL